MHHHRIWDDNFLGKKPYNSFKSYKFKQLNIGLNSKIDYIISGNNPAHYFGNSARIKNNIVNHNIIFWSDIVNGIKCYNIGMAGSGGVKVPERNIATYLLIEISNNGVNIIPSEYKLKHSNNLEYKLKHFNKININDLQNIQDTDLDVIFNYIMFRIKSKTFIAGFTIGIIFILFIFILHKIIRTKSKY